jgi:[ribosomal protein S18]-alanine N-acetyltransferase
MHASLKGQASVRLEMVPMNTADAADVSSWRYDGAYAFYDLDADPDDYAEFHDPAGWGVRYFAAHDERGELIGMFYFLMDDPSDTLTVGLGLRPDLTGQGLGVAYLNAGLAWVDERFAPRRVILTVAAFNTRAIRVYERAGFRQTREFIHHTNGEDWDFIEMECVAR